MKKILIIDDEEAIVELLEMVVLDELDLEVITASSGNEAIELLKSNSEIDLLVSDYSMPNGTGGDVYQYNKSHSKLPFILLSGGFLSDHEDMAGFSEQTIPHFQVDKPFQVDLFIGAIKKCLEYLDSSD